MKAILCNEVTEGLGFMLKKRIDKNEWKIETYSRKENPKFFKKHGIRSCPVLLIFDGKVVDTVLKGVEDISEWLEANKGNYEPKDLS